MNSLVLLKKSSSLHASKRVALNALTHLLFSPSTYGDDKFISGNTQFNSFTTASTANTSRNRNWVDGKFGVSVRGFHSGGYLKAGYAVADLPEDDEGLEISKLGISQEIVSALEKKGITKLFPIQVFPQSNYHFLLEKMFLFQLLGCVGVIRNVFSWKVMC